MDAVKPGSVLTTEHPGYDYLLQHIEGCITYDLTVLASPLRPLECNTQRFYFPQCKAYELDHRGADKLHRKRFWNAVGSFGAYYPPAMYHALTQNRDVFETGRAEPLVQTQARCVYANRFDGGQGEAGKVVWTLYNAAGHTFGGPVLRWPARPGRHVFDLLNLRQADARADGADTVVHVLLARDDVACLASLPSILGPVTRPSPTTLKVNLARTQDDPTGGPAWRLGVCGRDGELHSLQPARPGENTIDLGEFLKAHSNRPPVCVKLVDPSGQLIDAAAVE
ncbi:MAG: hypothetical protein BWX88_00763 [Planctomycetes bacterium ADurb.Bin126]|nr:MAG: hypothetical protein BWX88_00763 [Planctomycetes bacterium ADurb.Bin126]